MAGEYDTAHNLASLEEELMRTSSYSSLPFLLDSWCYVDADDWLRLLGKYWTGFDNASEHAFDLLEATSICRTDDGPILQMMDEEELVAFDRLPDTLTVYRGCYAHNKWGFSWSLSREVAEGFPFLNRYRSSGAPLLVKGSIKKIDVAALKLDRNEQEIITFTRPKCISTSRARDPQPLQQSNEVHNVGNIVHQLVEVEAWADL